MGALARGQSSGPQFAYLKNGGNDDSSHPTWVGF